MSLLCCLALFVAPDLFGVEAPPTPALERAAMELREQRAWQRELRPTFRRGPAGFHLAKAAYLTQGQASLNLEMIQKGLALGHFGCDDDELKQGELEAALLAARAAQEGELGLFEGHPPVAPIDFPLAGVALPMHYKQMDADYAWELREIKQLGAEWVNLLVVTRQARVDSSEVPLTSERTPSDERIRATIRLAHKLGLKVQLMPIVILREAGPKDWRGTLKPKDLGGWWRSYDAFICHMADLARDADAEAFSVGSEFASMESQVGPWKRVIANVRMRYGGRLTYSANWDHFAKVPFWKQLDFASMTAYFTLCPQIEEMDGSTSLPEQFANIEDCVRAGWEAGLDEVERLAHISRLPVVLSEVGVPSVTGALAGPWDYTLNSAPDPDSQALAFRTFHQVFVPYGEPAPFFSGCFFYDYWGLGGLEDKSYTARGKPAAGEWRAMLLDLKD